MTYRLLRKYCLLAVVMLLARTNSYGQSCTDLFPLNAPNPTAGSFFGERASVSERFAIVGANTDPSKGILGQAHVYEYVGGIWVFRQTLGAPGIRLADAFGSHVFIDENTALVAARGYSRPGSPAVGSGAVFVYTRQGTQWVQTGFFQNPSNTYAGGFGTALAKSGDDVVVGCEYNGSQNFAAYVFRQQGSAWALAATLTPQPGNTGYDFGYSVAINNDNLVIGSLDAFSFGRSAAYFYHRSATGVWALAQVEAYPNGSRAGFSVALHGQYAAIGSDSNLGVRLYERTATGWQLQQTLYNPDVAQVTPGRYGFTVALSGTTLLVSNPFDNRTANVAGVVYRYARTNNAWQLRRRYFAAQPQAFDVFGGWVALDANSHNLIIGASGRPSLGVSNAGQAFVQWEPAVRPAGPFCASSAVVTLQATAPGGTWAGPGVTNAQTGEFNPAVAGAGTHRVAYSLSTAAPACTFRDTVTIIVNPVLRITRVPLALSCRRDTTVQMRANLPGGTWSGVGIINAQLGLFRTSIAGPGRHVLAYSLPGNACNPQDTVSVVVQPTRVQLQRPSPVLTCARDTTFGLVATPAGGSWLGRGIINAQAGTFSSAVAGPGRHVLTYRLAAATPCFAQDTLSVVVQPQAAHILTRGFNLCRADTLVALAAQPAGGVWDGPGTAARPGFFSSVGLANGRYVVYYRLGTGACQATDSIVVTVARVAAPQLSLTPPRCGEPAAELRLVNQAPGGALYEWQYASADAPSFWQVLPSANQSTYLATRAGFYRLKISESMGTCAAFSAPTEYRTEPVYSAAAPNIFTPNGDKVNDEFELRLQHPQTSKLQVFNRWGQEVFSTKTYGHFWNGEGAAAGIYYYLWRYTTDCDPVEHTLKGWVELVR